MSNDHCRREHELVDLVARLEDAIHELHEKHVGDPIIVPLVETAIYLRRLYRET
jgi:hypothetical protein